jgi:FtsP/CotA-like multicopper oxidase with cupredoxin domain/putative cell wall-binding protein
MRWAPIVALVLVSVLASGAGPRGFAGSIGGDSAKQAELKARVARINASKVTLEERKAAAARVRVMKAVAGQSGSATLGARSLSSRTFAATGTPGPGGVPDYFGSTPNWAYSPLIRKFVDTFPGLGPSNQNNLGQYLSVANPDTITYPGTDYYEIELREYSQKLHSDLPATKLRGYVQVNQGTDAQGHNTVDPDPIRYLGPTIVATKDRPVRVKFTNKLPTGAGGDLFIPVDTSIMGAGEGPTASSDPSATTRVMYKQNRGTLHLHGGLTPWISDGTPHQWITPAGEDTPYPRGVSVKNVPDMPDPGDGSQTFFYSNQQSARMLWIHDHSFGITRLNVYVGEAQAYLLTDDAEKKLIADNIIPSDQIPLVLQDKTFVDADTIGQTDPTWNWGITPGTPHTGDLWVPHVYVPAQNPALPDGINPTGRWHYGPWFWPPVTANISHPPTSNPYYDPINAPWEPPLMPATPNPSAGMENYNDTPLVNGTAYPKLTVQPKSYRMRILNAANDRFFNLQMYVADGSVQSSDGRRNTEVKMVPAATTPGFPELWPTDGRVGGVPDPSTAGPEWVQIGTESGFLPMPTVIPQQPVTWNMDPTMFNFGNVQDHSLLLGNAERADVIVDFSKYAGKTLILYNDAPTAFPALDPRTDYFTGDEDHTDVGGTASTNIGFGPNTRTIMQINVAAATPAPAFNVGRLNAAFRSTNETEGVFESSQNPLIVPDTRYSATYHQPYADDPYVRIFQTEMTFKTLGSETVTFPLGAKAIQDEQGETFDPDYGRMSAKLGLERPTGVAGAPNFILYSFVDTSTEVLQDQVTPLTPIQPNGTQIWKITHNGVDTHPVHFHLFDVQVINRVGWDGFIRTPDDNELGWKETVRISPLEDTIVALRPIAARMSFGIPDSMRPLNPATPIGSDMGLSQIDPATGQRYVVPISNQVVNFGWEYVWHCHILSHEEMDMMRPMTLAVARSLSATPSLAATGVPGDPIDLRWTDSTPGDNLAMLGNPANEIGFRVERATVTSAGVESTYTAVGAALANITTYEDTTTVAGTGYRYRVIAYNAAGEAVSNAVTVVPNPYFDEYTITPTAGMGGAIAPSTAATVAAGSNSGTFTVTADSGFTIADVLVDGVSIGAASSYRFTGVVSDHTIWALFAPDTYDIVSTAGAHGAISPDTTQSVAVGADRTYTITPDTGYHIALLTVDGAKAPSLTTYTFTDVAAPHEIAVTFEKNAYTITPTAGAHGSLTPGAIKWLNYGDDATVTVAADTGYLILDVVVDGVSVGSTTSVNFQNVTADHTVEASFGPSHFAIVPSASAGGSITPGTSQMVPTFSDATYTITPDPGYHLASLRVDGVAVANTSSYTFTNVIAAHTIAATFARNTITMTRYGNSRYTNAVNLARLSYPRWRGVRHVVIASGEEASKPRFEAATAAGLAGAYGAPLLLVSKSTLPRAVRSALIAMPNGLRVHIVGGTSGVSRSVQSAIRRVPGVTYVDRFAGADRFGTASAVARRMKVVLGSRMPTSTLIVGATYNANVPDAVAASVVSARTHMPLLYVSGTSVPSVTRAALNDLQLSKRYIVGGTTSVAPAVQAALAVAPGDRIGGPVWPNTVAAVATRAKAEGWLPSTGVGFAYHTRYMTGIGAYLGLRGAPFLGTYSRSVPGATAGFLTVNKGDITRGYIFGPTSSVSNTARTRLLNYLR